MTKKTIECLIPSIFENGLSGNECLGMLRQSLRVHSPILCSLVVDLMRNKYLPVSTSVLACSRSCFRSGSPLFDSIPAEEYGRIARRSKITRSFVGSLDGSADMASLSIIEDYHVRLKGNEILVTQRFVPLKIDDDGKVTVGLLVITPSVNSSFGELAVMYGEKVWRYDESIHSFVECQKLIISESEKLLLLLSVGGASVREIAKRLCLSENTVKTKRRRLFKKLRVTSLMAAMTMMDNYALW